MDEIWVVECDYGSRWSWEIIHTDKSEDAATKWMNSNQHNTFFWSYRVRHFVAAVAAQPPRGGVKE